LGNVTEKFEWWDGWGQNRGQMRGLNTITHTDHEGRHRGIEGAVPS